METLSDQGIKKFLENSPLYSWKTFAQPEKMRTSLWIREIDEFCETCNQIRPFQDLRSLGGITSHHPMGKIQFLQSGTSYFTFTCVSCKTENHTFLVEQEVTEETVKIQKYGQRPRKKLERDGKLQKFFKEDAEYYEKALISLSNGYGIAAFAYFRRIVELNIVKLLDLLASDLDPSQANDPIKIAIDELRKESPMSDKIKIANNALPEYLKPDGLNPLGTIYSLLSEGVHSLTDEECLVKAESLQACLSFLIAELASRKRHKDSFKKMVGGLKGS
ncbi:hypothetical protein SHAM105786_15925 [Shewanella amazonensis]|uniref:Uncharacterized protein n=1 Tax=Shewanella amazonensis (strain ATCC BAA-1098 / SB2B) TaxID=326297 RepID=A1S2C1_SHEAM|nr:hypothetical protein [Shewanella amazonensis]ABL98527.1 hypothetical protein Sama_0316 [Shewanella amazonensis SB2B]